MKRIFPSGQYKKDYKRYRNQPQKLKALGTILNMLANEQPIPDQYKPHMLHGDYRGCMECHIESDLLLIWVDGVNNIIELVRLGSHSELFGKQR
ncbi:MAG: type II toxin-antitoxin system YafQ family toxin [Bacteroidaceae bacterium]|nr:type II toxin-antitoxin system YafQ family toxin [Bacteroidaceae bacterium]